MFDEIHQVYSGGQWIARPVKHAAPPELLGSADKYFTAFQRSYPLGSPDDNYVWLQLRHPSLILLARLIYPTQRSLYEPAVCIDGRALYAEKNRLRLADGELDTSSNAALAIRTLKTYLVEHFSYVWDALAQFPRDHTSWPLLWTWFTAGQELATIHEVTGEMMALQLDNWAYVQESMGRAFVLSCHYYQWAGTSYHRIPTTRKVMEFENLRSIKDLPTSPLLDVHKDLLRARGLHYMQYAQHMSHAAYVGFFHTRTFSGPSKVVGVGEVMIDVKSFRICNPVLDHWGDDVNGVPSQSKYQTYSADASRPCPTVEADACHLLPPSIHGFSFRTKRWGEFMITGLRPIQWRDTSFEHLVIPAAHRRIVRSLITVHTSDLRQQIVKDVVEGKGNGLIMAFHGSPGTGKTLTAEAVAEHLRKPLYVVSAGELGTTASVLEKKLKDVLELATSWNAVLLVDEADIFLTKRDTRDIERNALVGIFLRLLEYFTGVMILTTNHIENFDHAFLSRFAVMLSFEELDGYSRKVLWKRFLTRVGGDFERFDIERLSAFRMNGRDIKHTIQTAQAIALVEGEELNTAHFLEVIEVAKGSQFAVKSNAA